MEDSRLCGAFHCALPEGQVMDAEEPLNETEALFTDESYEDRQFTSLACQDTELKDIEFFQCRFDGCRFLRTTFRQCRFEQCVFEKCDVSLLKVPESSFIGVRFLNSKMLGIDWTQAAVPLTLAFQGSNVSHSMFMRLSLQRMEMVECIAREVDFTGTNLTRANLAKTDFLGSRFADTNLSYADFSKAVNYAIDPRANRLKKAVFSMPEAVSLLSAFDIVLK
jgi:fluoroquinolone resistance protein